MPLHARWTRGQATHVHARAPLTRALLVRLLLVRLLRGRCTCRYMEIYNESVNDLLNPAGKNLPIYEHPKRGVFVRGLAEEVVISAGEVAARLRAGEEQRHVAYTNFNAVSSRSHTVFRVVLESKAVRASSALAPHSPATGVGGHGKGSGVGLVVPSVPARGGKRSSKRGVRLSTLNLVDLAGSENVRATKSKGQRRKVRGRRLRWCLGRELVLVTALVLLLLPCVAACAFLTPTWLRTPPVCDVMCFDVTCAGGWLHQQVAAHPWPCHFEAQRQVRRQRLCVALCMRACDVWGTADNATAEHTRLPVPRPCSCLRVVWLDCMRACSPGAKARAAT